MGASPSPEGLQGMRTIRQCSLQASEHLMSSIYALLNSRQKRRCETPPVSRYERASGNQSPQTVPLRFKVSTAPVTASLRSLLSADKSAVSR